MGGRLDLEFLKYSTFHLESIDTQFAHIMTFNGNVSAVCSKKSDQNENFEFEKLGDLSFSKFSFPTQTWSTQMLTKDVVHGLYMFTYISFF